MLAVSTVPVGSRR